MSEGKYQNPKKIPTNPAKHIITVSDSQELEESVGGAGVRGMRGPSQPLQDPENPGFRMIGCHCPASAHLCWRRSVWPLLLLSPGTEIGGVESDSLIFPIRETVEYLTESVWERESERDAVVCGRPVMKGPTA